jgi:hypothetical protein
MKGCTLPTLLSFEAQSGCVKSAGSIAERVSAYKPCRGDRAGYVLLQSVYLPPASDDLTNGIGAAVRVFHPERALGVIPPFAVDHESIMVGTWLEGHVG